MPSPAPALRLVRLVKSLNGLNDAVTLVAGANVTLGTNSNTLTLAAAGGFGVGPLFFHAETV